MKKTYKTAGKQGLLLFFEQHPDRQFTVEELYCAVSQETSVGKSSVYRHLALLCENETVKRFYSDERGKNVYQYVGEGCDCRAHFHEKCVRCGSVVHLDCHAMEEAAAHLLGEHGFLVDPGQTILYGVCLACRSKEELTHA